jgi:hypothetical protein
MAQDSQPTAEITAAWLKEIGFEREGRHGDIWRMVIPPLPLNKVQLTTGGSRGLIVRVMQPAWRNWKVAICPPNWSKEGDQVFVTGREFLDQSSILSLISALGWDGIKKEVPE